MLKYHVHKAADINKLCIEYKTNNEYQDNQNALSTKLDKFQVVEYKDTTVYNKYKMKCFLKDFSPVLLWYFIMVSHRKEKQTFLCSPISTPQNSSISI